MTNRQALIEKIQALPPERLDEVEDFVDFLDAKSRRLAALDRLLAIAPALEAAGAATMTEDELQTEVSTVKWRVLEQTMSEARGKFADLPPDELDSLLQDAVAATVNITADNAN